MTIDRKALPLRTMIDTGVLIRALGDRPDDPDSAVCRELFESILETGKRILVAAPSIAEFLRGRGGSEPPAFEGVDVISFDYAAASLTGSKFPPSILKSVPGGTGTALKYDALILGCALRARANCLVTLDARMGPLAEAVRMQLKRPEDFLEPQASLPFPEEPQA